jgi:hypothetical protein
MALIPTLAEIYALARATLADVGSEVYTDTVLAPFTKRACHKAARYLRSEGVGLFRKESSEITVAAGTVALNRTGGTVYPTDMLRPIELKERQTTETAADFKAMRCQNGFLPADTAVGTARQIWDWINDTIVFPAATTESKIKIQYEAYFTDPASYTPADPATTTIAIPDAGEAIALLTAAYAFQSRDERENGAAAYAQAMDDLLMIATAEKNVATARAARYGRQ